MLVWCLLVQWRIVHREEEFRTVTVKEPPDPVSEMQGVFSNKNILSTSQSKPKAIATDYSFKESVEQP